jgi:glycosyltransferase involved in cell wall biosynthesis
MKVFFTLDTLGIGGTEGSTLEIISRFSQNTKVKLIYFYPPHDLKEEYEKAGIEVQFVPLKTKTSFIQGVKSLIKIIREEKPDLVVSSIAKADLISRIACWITRTKVIGTFINDTYGESRIKEMKMKKKYLTFYYFWMLDKITAKIPVYWISNSKSIAYSNANALNIRKNKIQVIYRGRETKNFLNWESQAIHQNFKFVFLGRLIERKGLRELIEAFVNLKETHKDIQLDIYGKGDFHNELKKLIAQHDMTDSIFLNGPVLNGYTKLYDSHCFVFPSWYEGFSGTLIEAMLAGIPIIASNISMNLEAVTDQKTALIFKVNDKVDLIEKMKAMISHYPEMVEMGKQARLEALSRFDINIISEQYETFLKSVVENKVDTTQLLQKQD